MAFRTSCLCGAIINVRADTPALCSNCNGVRQRELLEQERWDNLHLHTKVEELKRRIEALEQRMHNDGRIG